MLVGRNASADNPQDVTTRILIADDHPLTRDALAGLLEQHGFAVVGTADDGAEAIEEARRLQPDIVVLDLSMPGLDGLSALPRIRGAAPQCEVVVLTASGTEENLLAAIRAGAAGYLLKSEPPERIASFLRGVAEGEAALSGTVARRLLDQVREGGGDRSGVPDARRLLDQVREGGGDRSGVPDSIASVLSAREVEVLLLLDDHAGTEEIAKRLFISEHTVRSHVKSLTRKLGASSRREALEMLADARR
jgi:DNA-binding NarL/FixJ family response regulator